ncbi:MAG: hypothetical protein WCK96_02055 [Methylococcales bacterium]
MRLLRSKFFSIQQLKIRLQAYFFACNLFPELVQAIAVNYGDHISETGINKPESIEGLGAWLYCDCRTLICTAVPL